MQHPLLVGAVLCEATAHQWRAPWPAEERRAIYQAHREMVADRLGSSATPQIHDSADVVEDAPDSDLPQRAENLARSRSGRRRRSVTDCVPSLLRRNAARANPSLDSGTSRLALRRSLSSKVHLWRCELRRQLSSFLTPRRRRLRTIQHSGRRRPAEPAKPWRPQ
jgi:hypothetical protein